jgi:hypothetical protein
MVIHSGAFTARSGNRETGQDETRRLATLRDENSRLSCGLRDGLRWAETGRDAAN